MRVLTKALVLAVVLVVLFFGGAIVPAAATDNVIMPGESIGPVHLGMSETDLLRDLGPADTTLYDKNALLKIYGWWHPTGHTFAFVRNGTVLEASTTEPEYTLLTGGLHYGSTATEVMKALGSPQSDKPRIVHMHMTPKDPPKTVWARVLGYQGIEFWIDKADPQSRVLNIIVFKP